MKVGEAIAEIMKREGFDILCAYPVNHLIEHAANLDIRTVIVRQERIGLHMADAISRVTSGKKLGAFCMPSCPAAIRGASRRSAPTIMPRATCGASRRARNRSPAPTKW
jgi:thiamine pyrophosphate-dependent acetolactate synthase large subunit-like protein